MNAYELTDELQKHGLNGDNYGLFNKRIQNMLRQQADRIAHLEMLVANRNEIIDKLDLAPQTKPLSDEEIDELWKIYTKKDSYYFGFAKAIEERHGIK